MSDEPTPCQLSERIARLEERIETMKAENTSAQERLNATLEGFRKDQIQLKLWIVLTAVGSVGTILGILRYFQLSM